MKIPQYKTTWTRSIPCSQYMISEDFMNSKLYLMDQVQKYVFFASHITTCSTKQAEQPIG